MICFSSPTYCLSVKDKALKYLLKEADFLYSNGLNNVYTKPGGYQRALDDFTKFNEAKRITKLSVPGGFHVSFSNNRFINLTYDRILTY